MTTPPVPQYDPNSPAKPSEFIATSQPVFLANFQTLYDTFLKNHIPLDALTSPGNHTIIQLTEQIGSFQTNVGELAIYTKDAPGQTDQLFMRFQGDQPEFQLTNYQIYTVGGASYFTFLPGRILVYFGQFDGVLNFQTPILLNLVPPVAKNIISVNMTVAGVLDYESPRITLTAPDSTTKIIKTINVYASTGVQIAPKVTINYVIMANI